MDNGVERIEDQDLLAQVRRQAKQVYIKSLLAGAALTVVFLLLPF